ncbi:DNA/RNA non-specific endonuclease [Actinomadura soli]|uniref:DNA/RNA non-specific endonuclease n=1 Tax=Actinomadura soli TaxID=2508997 RepID=UPI0038B365A1
MAIAPPAAASPARTPPVGGPAAPVRQVDQVPCEPHIGANATYRAHGAEFRTDAQGRPTTAEAVNLTRSEADRGPCQTKVGHMAPAAGYDGGHLIAATCTVSTSVTTWSRSGPASIAASTSRWRPEPRNA